MKKKFKITEKRRKRKTLIRLLDSAFSKYIRAKYAKNGLVWCFTCSKRLPIKEIQNGHYISRACLVLRYDEDNCRPQCSSCNIFRNGQSVTFRENLVKELGEDKVKALEALRFKVFKPSSDWFEDKLKHYNALLF